MTQEKTVKTLKISSLIVLFYGLFSIPATMIETSFISDWTIDLIFWPLDGNPVRQAEEVGLFWAILSGLAAAFGLMLWQISDKLYTKERHLARLIIFQGLGLWFVVDSFGSILAGAPYNLIGNLFFLSLFLIPLLFDKEKQA